MSFIVIYMNSTPIGKMAPTLFIGLAPTAILVIILVKMVSVFPHIETIEVQNSKAVAQILGSMLWGFSLWWLILSIGKTVYALVKKTLTFTLSWWAFTFPIGAIAVATGSLNSLFMASALNIIQIGLTIFLLVIWLIVSIFTIKGITNGSIFEEE